MLIGDTVGSAAFTELSTCLTDTYAEDYRQTGGVNPFYRTRREVNFRVMV